jgi:hypothetical protein
MENSRFGKTNTYFGKAGVRSKEFNANLVELTWSRGPVLAKAHIGTAKSEFELIGDRLSIRVVSSTKPTPETIGRSR